MGMLQLAVDGQSYPNTDRLTYSRGELPHVHRFHDRSALGEVSKSNIKNWREYRLPQRKDNTPQNTRTTPSNPLEALKNSIDMPRVHTPDIMIFWTFTPIFSWRSTSKDIGI